LPDWFVQKDADGDGQVSMAEFATEWTDAKAAEFQKYDMNNDGFITPEECLRAEKAK
jgi:Ca2+-binding EF-hand superfamily protein